MSFSAENDTEEEFEEGVAEGEVADGEDDLQADSDEPVPAETVELPEEHVVAAAEPVVEPVVEKPAEVAKAAAEVAKPAEEKPAKLTKAEKLAAKEKEEEARQAIPELDEERAKLPWFVVQTYSGYELRVKLSLEERIRSHGLTPRFGNILVPQETVEEMVRGAKRTSKKKFFPGYILVQMALDDDTWHLVKDTPKVSGFIGDSRNPSPLSEAEVKALLQQMEGGAKRPRPKKQFEEGDAVKVVDGPFADFNGTVDEVKPDKGKLRVLISIFGRNTPVELDFVQVEKV